MAHKAGTEKTVDFQNIGAENRHSENRLRDDAAKDRSSFNEATSNEHELTAEAATENAFARKQTPAVWLVTLGLIAAIVLGGTIWILAGKSAGEAESNAAGEITTADKSSALGGAAAPTSSGSIIVKLSPAAVQAAQMQIEGVTMRSAVAPLHVTGAVEMNPSQTQSVTPLVGGRVERVFYQVGDKVGRGAVLATVASPEVARIHGKMHEAETQLAVATRNLERVERTENRVAVLQSKARLDEAEATLRRMRRLAEVGASAGKDLIAAETAHKSAQAEYNFQSNITLNKEIQEARAAVDTARADLRHILDEMRALGAPVEKEGSEHQGESAVIYLRAPAAGQVTERFINDGAGVEAGKSLFTISNLASVFVIANVPETQMSMVSTGTLAEVKLPIGGAVRARVSFIEPNLNQDTRTGRVRLEVANANGSLRAGMFVEVDLLVGARHEELVVPTEAVQNIDGRNVVFIPQANDNNAFELRAVETAGEVENYTRVRDGLRLGDKVVTKGSFALKTQLKKTDVEE